MRARKFFLHIEQIKQAIFYGNPWVALINKMCFVFREWEWISEKKKEREREKQESFKKKMKKRTQTTSFLLFPFMGMQCYFPTQSRISISSLARILRPIFWPFATCDLLRFSEIKYCDFFAIFKCEKFPLKRQRFLLWKHVLMCHRILKKVSCLYSNFLLPHLSYLLFTLPNQTRKEDRELSCLAPGWPPTAGLQLQGRVKVDTGVIRLVSSRGGTSCLWRVWQYVFQKLSCFDACHFLILALKQEWIQISNSYFFCIMSIVTLKIGKRALENFKTFYLKCWWTITRKNHRIADFM